VMMNLLLMLISLDLLSQIYKIVLKWIQNKKFSFFFITLKKHQIPIYLSELLTLLQK